MSTNNDYIIIRFFMDEAIDTMFVRYALTLEDAQEHCHRKDTQGDGWFDGYDHASAWPSLVAEYEANK